MSKADNKYFDATASIADYEAKTGLKASDYLADITRMMEPIINKAYADGYKAGTATKRQDNA